MSLLEMLIYLGLFGLFGTLLYGVLNNGMRSNLTLAADFEARERLVVATDRLLTQLSNSDPSGTAFKDGTNQTMMFTVPITGATRDGARVWSSGGDRWSLDKTTQKLTQTHFDSSALASCNLGLGSSTVPNLSSQIDAISALSGSPLLTLADIQSWQWTTSGSVQQGYGYSVTFTLKTSVGNFRYSRTSR